MKSMRPPSEAIFFRTYFYRAGGHDPIAPALDPLLLQKKNLDTRVSEEIAMAAQTYRTWIMNQETLGQKDSQLCGRLSFLYFGLEKFI